MNHYLVDTNVIIDMLLDRNDADAVQNYSALDVKQITGIITRNAKDFERSSLKIINPRSFI